MCHDVPQNPGSWKSSTKQTLHQWTELVRNGNAVSAAPEVARAQNMCRTPAYSRIPCFDALRIPVFRVSTPS
eukprot:1883877-Prymnesium_polylepis.1